MSIAKKQQTASTNNATFSSNNVIIAENEKKVFDAGKKAERVYFFNIYQDYGKRRDYANAFYYLWFDEIYDPIYPLDCGTGANATTNMFAWSYITDTKVEIIAKKTTHMMFYQASSLRIIRKLTVAETTEIPNNTFIGCTALEELIMSGTLAKALNISHTKKLNKASHISIFSCIPNDATGFTVTFSQTAVNKAFETSEGANDGSTSAEWSTLVDSKSCTISLV